jgi:protein-S-isoprenylcysteine O-methyltransferase Ste14
MEEKNLLEQYGAEYEAYAWRTSRLNKIGRAWEFNGDGSR